MGQSSAQLTILHRSPAKVNTVNYLFCSPTPDPAPRVEQGAEGQLSQTGHFAQNAGQAASSDRHLAHDRIASTLSLRKARSSSSLTRRSHKSFPRTFVSREERKSYLLSMSLRRSVR